MVQKPIYIALAEDTAKRLIILMVLCVGFVREIKCWLADMLLDLCWGILTGLEMRVFCMHKFGNILTTEVLKKKTKLDRSFSVCDVP